jgi:preprotein translocase subunit SecG
MLTGILTALLILTVIVLIVLVTVFQHGNEGGIGSSFGGGNSTGFFGASGGANIIIRGTWICGALFFGLSTTLAWVKTHDSFGVSKEISNSLSTMEGTPAASPAASAAPAAPAAPAEAVPAPATQSAVPAPESSTAPVK